MKFKNTSKESIAYRDDSGKHIVKAGDSFDLVGDQHEEGVLLIPGVERDEKGEAAEAKEIEKAAKEAEKAEAEAQAQEAAKA